jgi:hypothetical protein
MLQKIENTNCHNIIQNIVSILLKIGTIERYSGFFTTIIVFCSKIKYKFKKIGGFASNKQEICIGWSKKERILHQQPIKKV